MSIETIHRCDICGEKGERVRMLGIHFTGMKRGQFKIVKQNMIGFDTTQKHICFECARTMLNELNIHHKL